MLCEILLEQVLDLGLTPFIFMISPKSASYDLLLALRCFVNTGPGHSG